MAEQPLTTAAARREHDLPTGVVTFLFTDIEGSTRMLEEHRAEAGDALACHHELLRGAIEDASGVVFETVGDAVYGAFARPLDAIGEERRAEVVRAASLDLAAVERDSNLELSDLSPVLGL